MMRPPRRIYPRWLPPTPTQRAELLQMRRTQRNVLTWLIAFIPAGWAVIAITRSDVMLVPFSVLWIAAGMALARRVTDRRCPRCGESFCAKSGLPSGTACSTNVVRVAALHYCPNRSTINRDNER